MSAMNGNPLVSVYCSVYNHEPFLRDALDGFVSQVTTFPFEVFVHDDCSTDNSRAIIMEYAKRYPEIIIPVFESENQYSKGASPLRERVLPRARGKYIALCEGDDYWTDSRKLQYQVDYLESHPSVAACVHNTLMLFYGTEKVAEVSQQRADGLISLKSLVQESGSYHTSSLMCRRTYYDNTPDFVFLSKGVGDYPMRIALGLMGGIYYINKIMSTYRFQTPGSWSSKMKEDRHAAMQFRMNIIDMLRAADAFSTGKYADLFRFAINEQLYALYDLKHEWRKMMASDMKEVRKKKPFRHKVRIMISSTLPALGRYLVRK